MSNSSEKETATALPSREVTSPSAPPVLTAPPKASKGYDIGQTQNQQPKEYPVQQIPMQGIPSIKNQSYPEAYPQHNPQQYPPRFRSTQAGLSQSYPTYQSYPTSTPLCDATCYDFLYCFFCCWIIDCCLCK